MASPRFEVQDGEIVDLQNRQIISPDQFNRLATPQDRTRLESQLGGAGVLESGPSGDGPDETDPSAQRSLPSASAATSSSTPSLSEFMPAAKAANPHHSDRQIRQYWAKHYSTIDPKTLPALDTFMKKAEEANPDASSDELEHYWENNYGDFGAARETPPKSSVLRRAADVPIGLAKGLVDLPKAALGLADIATGGYAGEGATAILDAMGRASDAVGLPAWARPSQWSDQLRNLYSKETKENLAAVGEKAKTAESEAKDSGSGPMGQIAASAGGAIKGLASNPGALIPLAAENYGGMKVIAMGTAKLLAPLSKSLDTAVKAGSMTAEEANAALGKAAIKYAAAGEGVLTSGQVSSGISTDDPSADFAHRLAAVIAGATTAGITRGAAKIPGLGDVEASMATKSLGKATGFQGSLPARVGKGALSEGVIQELPQSGQEQALQNIGASKPWQQGVGEQAIEGMAAGGALGGGMAGMSGRRPGIRATESPIEEPASTVNDIMAAPDVDTAIAHMQSMVSAPGSASGERVTDPGLSQDADVARLTRQIERGGATGPVGSASGPDLGSSQAEPNALNALIERGGSLQNQADLTQAADRTRQPFDVPVLNGPGPLDQPAIQPGQAFTPRAEPEADPRAALQDERTRLIAQREARIVPRGTVPTWDTINRGDMVTLYRGEDPNNDKGGQWWTTDPSKAALYGNVSSVTLPAEVVGANAAQGHGGADEFVFTGKSPQDLAQSTPSGAPPQTAAEKAAYQPVEKRPSHAPATVLPESVQPSVNRDLTGVASRQGTQPMIPPVPTKQVDAPERKITPYKLNPVENTAPPVTGPSVQDLHALAAQKGFNIEGTVFRELTKMVTGKAHLDDLSPKQRQTFSNTLQKIPDKAYSSPAAKPKPKTQPVAIPTGQTATEGNQAQNERLAIQLKEFSNRFKKAGSMAGKVRTGEADKLAVMLDAAKVPYTTRTNRSKDIVTFLHVKDKPFQLGGYFKDELKPSEATHQPMPPQPASVELQKSPADSPSPAVQDEQPSTEAAPIARPTPIQAEKAKLQKKPKAEHPSENYRLLPVKTREKFEEAFTGAETADRPSIRTLKEWLNPANKTVRAEFERRSGVTLPKGLAATNAAVEEYFKKPTQGNTSPVPSEEVKEPKSAISVPSKHAGEPFSLTSQAEAKPKAKGPEQLSIDVPPTQIAGQPIIGREAQPGEAPLFSKDAQEAGLEQMAIPEAPSVQPDIPVHYESIPAGIMVNVKGIRASTGQEISVKEDAASALRRLDETLVQYRQLQKCVNV